MPFGANTRPEVTSSHGWRIRKTRAPGHLYVHAFPAFCATVIPVVQCFGVWFSRRRRGHMGFGEVMRPGMVDVSCAQIWFPSGALYREQILCPAVLCRPVGMRVVSRDVMLWTLCGRCVEISCAALLTQGVSPACCRVRRFSSTDDNGTDWGTGGLQSQRVGHALPARFAAINRAAGRKRLPCWLRRFGGNLRSGVGRQPDIMMGCVIRPVFPLLGRHDADVGLHGRHQV